MATASQPLTDAPHDASSRLTAFLKRELAPAPDRLSVSVRIAIAAVLITLIGETGRSPQIFLALFVLLLLPRDYPKQTWQAARTVVMLAWASCFVAIALNLLVADLIWARVVAIGGGTFFSMLLSRGFRQPLIGVLGSVTISQTLIQLDASPSTTASYEAALWQALMLSTGALVATAIEYLYPHPGPLQRVEDGIAERLQAVSAVLKKTSGKQMSLEDQRSLESISRVALNGTSTLRRALPAISSNDLPSRNYILRLSSLLIGIEAMNDLAVQLNRYGSETFDGEQRNHAADLSGRVDELADRARKQVIAGPPHEVEQSEMDQPRDDGPVLLLFRMRELLDSIETGEFAQTGSGEELSPPDFQPPRAAAPRAGPFFTSDNVHFATKVTLASMICYVIYNGVDWQGISSSLVTCYAVAMDTAGATFRKLALRTIGILIGSLLFGIGGISLILSGFDNILELLLYVAGVFFVSGWVVKGSQRISYAGVQIGLSFGLVALISPTIPAEIVGARDRFVGVLLGALAMWIVFGRLWPVNALRDQRVKIAELPVNAAELIILADDQRSREQKIAKMRELRDSASQAIFMANDQADSAGYDSHYDAGVQQCLRDCLKTAQALVLLETTEVDISLGSQGTQHLPNLAGTNLGQKYALFLRALSDQIKNGDEKRIKELHEDSTQLQKTSEQTVADWEQAGLGESDTSQAYIKEKTRIVRRRCRLVQDLLVSVQDLARASQEAMNPST